MRKWTNRSSMGMEREKKGNRHRKRGGGEGKVTEI